MGYLRTVILGAGVLLIVAALVPRGRQLINYYVRTFLMLWLMLAIASVGTLRGIVLMILKDQEGLANLNYWTGSLYSRVASRVVGVPCVIRNIENLVKVSGPCVIVANHQSTLDMICVNSVVQPRTVAIAKKSLKHVPFLGWYFVVSGNVFVDRMNHERAVQALDEAGRQIRERQVKVVVFPEGTRSRTEGQMLPFKKGAFNLAVAAQVPIVPVVIENQKKVYDSQRRIFTGGPIRVSGTQKSALWTSNPRSRSFFTFVLPTFKCFPPFRQPA